VIYLGVKLRFSKYRNPEVETVFKMMLTRIFGLRTEEKKQGDEKYMIRSFIYFSIPIIFLKAKSRRIRWAGHVLGEIANS
jgi:hypothetical protein